ncbi:MAG: hypothetical protein AAFR61_26805 [Bacteroidota bacterium]
MKPSFLILSMLILCSPLFGQQDTLQQTIDGLLIEEQTENSVWKIKRWFYEDPQKLSPYKAQLEQKINLLLQSPLADFDAYLLALTMSGELITLSDETGKEVARMHRYYRDDMRQTADYHSWIWEDSVYQGQRSVSGLLLDLLGHVSDLDSQEELQLALANLEDCRLKMFAAASLIRRNVPVPAEEMKKIAADDEVRSTFFGMLEEMDKEAIFPKKYAKQPLLARSKMVDWLTYPTELGCVPGRIEALQEFRIDYDDVGEAIFYLWKFQKKGETEWLVGLSGPYLATEVPTANSYGYTFSKFEKLTDKKPEEHFADIMELIDSYHEEKE